MHIFSQPIHRGSTMKPAGSSTLHRALRTIAAVLSFTILVNQSAHAATLHQVPSVDPTPQAPPPPQAPIPPEIAAAHNVFIVNNGADQNFPISSQQAYNEVYSALQAWGRYQLVTSPDQADLVFQLHEIAPITGVYGDRAGAYAINSPAFRLAIKNPRTNVTLWTINSPVLIAGRKSTRDREANIAVTNLVSRVKVLANEPLSEIETADLTTYPHYHGKGLAITLVAVTVGAGLAAGLIMKHEFDNKVASQNAALCAQNPFFCNLPTP
jgi:hypothetical protein